MGFLLYTYSVTSIRAAKRNAKLHREADGGQLDMRRESQRRHGVLAKVPGTSGVELFRDVGITGMGEEKKIESIARDEQAKKLPRTEIEGSLEDYKGRGKAVEKFREKKPEQPED